MPKYSVSGRDEPDRVKKVYGGAAEMRWLAYRASQVENDPVFKRYLSGLVEQGKNI